MQYAMAVADAVLTLRLSGRMTFNDHALARTMIHEAVAAGARHVAIDVSGLTFIDSPGIGMLLIAQEEFRRVGARTILTGAQGMVQRVFRAAHIERVFDENLPIRDLPRRSVIAGLSPA